MFHFSVPEHWIWNFQMTKFRLMVLALLGATTIVQVIYVQAVYAQSDEAVSLRAISLQIEADESIHDDLVEGTEKKVLWYGESYQKTELSVVYIHGFTASRQESAPFSDLLAQALQANLFYTRLTGHGRSADAIAEGSAENWITDAREAFEIGTRLGEKVIVIGLSTGATLATYLASLPDSEDIHAVVLISPNYRVSDARAYYFDSVIGRWLYKRIYGEYNEYETLNEDHAAYWTERYPLDAISSLLDLLKVVKDLDKATISTPMIMFYSENDEVVEVGEMLNVFDAWGTEQKTKIVVDNSSDPAQHILMGDIISPDTTDAMVENTVNFVRSIEPM